MISLLVTILVLCLVVYVIVWLIGQMGLPDPIRTVVFGVLAIVVLLLLVNLLGVGDLRLLRG